VGSEYSSRFTEEYLTTLRGLKFYLQAIFRAHEIPNIDLVTHVNFLYLGGDLLVQSIIIVIG
jgi:hypothetical protein